MSKGEVLSLYKQLLRGMQTYPSKKRDVLYKEIQRGFTFVFLLKLILSIEFRENKTIQEPMKIQDKVEQARRSLDSLHRFSKPFSPSSTFWNLDLSDMSRPTARETSTVTTTATSRTSSNRTRDS
jgi:hypothetical protein